jgi:catechol 2,3-dioxygenase-like lactoylglutathione lyase family enzyme
MSNPAGATHIRQVGTVFVPVADQDRSLRFYVETLGFEKRGEYPYGGSHRWIEVAPAGSAIALALVPSSEGSSTATDRALCAFATTDIAADHETMRSRGVDVDARIGRAGTSRPGLVSTEVTVSDPVPPQFFFRDPDGNRFLIVEPG